MAQSQHAAKEVITREGDAGQKAFVVVSGKVELVRQMPHGEQQIAILGPGMCFGEMSLVNPGAPYPATARVLEPAAIETIETADLEKFLKPLPPAMGAMMQAIIGRFRKSFASPEENKLTGAVSKAELQKIVISPGTEELAKQFKDVAVAPAGLPFRIGGFPVENAAMKNRHNHLNIASDGPPLTVSRQHCEITLENDSLCVTDLGSRFCTIVNGSMIGRGQGRYQAPLNKGKNEIRLGANSPYKIIVACE